MVMKRQHRQLRHRAAVLTDAQRVKVRSPRVSHTCAVVDTHVLDSLGSVLMR